MARNPLDLPFAAIVLGKKFSGKTTFILNLINPKEFEQIWVITLTGHTGNLNKIQSDPDFILKDPTEEQLQEIIDERKELIEENGHAPNILILFDDFIGTRSLDFARSKVISEMATSGRHAGISLLFSSQHWTAIPLKVRGNAEFVFIFKHMANVTENLVRDIRPGGMNKDEFLEQLAEVNKSTTFDYLLFDSEQNEMHLMDGTKLKVMVKSNRKRKPKPWDKGEDTQSSSESDDEKFHDPKKQKTDK